MVALSDTELVYLNAVARKTAHGLSLEEREQARESARAKGLVEDAIMTAAGFQLSSITDRGRRALRAAKGQMRRAGLL